MRESELLRTCLDYLQIMQNQGKLCFLRLNSGALFPSHNGKSYKVQLCPEGTADVMVVMREFLGSSPGTPGRSDEEFWGTNVIFIETKAKNGELSDKQEEFRDRVTAQGAKYLEIRDLDELETEID